SVPRRQTCFNERDADTVTRGPQWRDGKQSEVIGWHCFDCRRHVCGGGAGRKSLVVSPQLPAEQQQKRGLRFHCCGAGLSESLRSSNRLVDVFSHRCSLTVYFSGVLW